MSRCRLQKVPLTGYLKRIRLPGSIDSHTGTVRGDRPSGGPMAPSSPATCCLIRTVLNYMKCTRGICPCLGKPRGKVSLPVFKGQCRLCAALITAEKDAAELSAPWTLTALPEHRDACQPPPWLSLVVTLMNKPLRGAVGIGKPSVKGRAWLLPHLSLPFRGAVAPGPPALGDPQLKCKSRGCSGIALGTGDFSWVTPADSVQCLRA